MIQSLGREKEKVGGEAAVATAAPGPTVRTAVSLLLFIHLFSLATVLLFNSSTSRFRENLRTMPGFYLRLLAMDYDLDAGVRFAAGEEENPRQQNKARRAMMHLTHADVHDVGFFVDFEYERDGQTQTVRMPPEGLWGQRKRYHQLLTWEMGRLAGTGEVDNEMPRAVGGWLARTSGVTTGAIRCRPLYLLNTENVLAPRERDDDNPWAARRYGPPVLAKQIILDGQEVLVSNIGAAGEVAPAPRSSSGAAGPSSGAPASGTSNGTPAPTGPQTPTTPQAPPALRQPPPEFRDPN